MRLWLSGELIPLIVKAAPDLTRSNTTTSSMLHRAALQGGLS
jgi:hypothetical protein